MMIDWLGQGAAVGAFQRNQAAVVADTCRPFPAWSCPVGNADLAPLEINTSTVSARSKGSFGSRASMGAFRLNAVTAHRPSAQTARNCTEFCFFIEL